MNCLHYCGTVFECYKVRFDRRRIALSWTTEAFEEEKVAVMLAVLFAFLI